MHFNKSKAYSIYKTWLKTPPAPCSYKNDFVHNHLQPSIYDFCSLSSGLSTFLDSKTFATCSPTSFNLIFDCSNSENAILIGSSVSVSMSGDALFTSCLALLIIRVVRRNEPPTCFESSSMFL